MKLARIVFYFQITKEDLHLLSMLTIETENHLISCFCFSVKAGQIINVEQVKLPMVSERKR